MPTLVLETEVDAPRKRVFDALGSRLDTLGRVAESDRWRAYLEPDS